MCVAGLQAYVIGMGAVNLLFILLFRKMGGLELDLATLSVGRAQHYDSVGRRGRAGLRCVTLALKPYQSANRPRPDTQHAPSAVVSSGRTCLKPTCRAFPQPPSPVHARGM